MGGIGEGEGGCRRIGNDVDDRGQQALHCASLQMQETAVEIARVRE